MNAYRHSRWYIADGDNMTDAGDMTATFGQMFAELLLQGREQREWSQIDLAKRSGLSQPTISDLENTGVPVNEDHISQVLKAFGITPKNMCSMLVTIGQVIEDAQRPKPPESPPVIPGSLLGSRGRPKSGQAPKIEEQAPPSADTNSRQKRKPRR